MPIKPFDSRHIYWDDDGVHERRQMQSVTSILGDALPKPALTRWAAKETAEEAINNWDELALLPIGERYDRLKGAPWAKANKLAVRGTDVHKLAERLTHGESVDVPDHLMPHVDSCIKFLDQRGFDAVLTESTVVNRSVDYAGTLDAVGDMKGKRWLIDWKTTGNVYSEVALQLVAYAKAECYLDKEGTERPMQSLGIEGAAVVWLRQDGYDVIPMRIDDEVWKAFRHTRWMARLLHQERLATNQYQSPMDRFKGEAIQ